MSEKTIRETIREQLLRDIFMGRDLQKENNSET